MAILEGNRYQRRPWLALTRRDIIEAAGFHFDTLAGVKMLSEVYSTYSPSILQLKDVAKSPWTGWHFGDGLPDQYLAAHEPLLESGALFAR